MLEHGNDVWVVSDPRAASDPIDVLAEVMPRRWIDEPALTHLPFGYATLDAGSVTLDM